MGRFWRSLKVGRITEKVSFPDDGFDGAIVYVVGMCVFDRQLGGAGCVSWVVKEMRTVEVEVEAEAEAKVQMASLARRDRGAGVS